ncbi:hypothetical protein RGQ15_14680 [Paracoccus sp. MBLB3053]|uniref:Uncharacterized protein n=1 Tax=Paracoccus aurantius TaxID=3073814 RepID=A0ABU2HUT3_9RHOB|nr:hypothetical protein [Paracoccus sp. MBLB3053]MDS9468808.1 hypothetical protein [Paracoccus sp. MBLB3053]
MRFCHSRVGQTAQIFEPEVWKQVSQTQSTPHRRLVPAQTGQDRMRAEVADRARFTGPIRDVTGKLPAR